MSWRECLAINGPLPKIVSALLSTILFPRKRCEITIPLRLVHSKLLRYSVSMSPDTPIINSLTQYESLSHVSDILWHFIGPRSFESFSEEKAINRLETYISDDGKRLRLAPYIEDSQYYLRILTLYEKTFGIQDASTLQDIIHFRVHEPRAVCFCDIPIPHLPIHMCKYGNIGVGIRRRSVSKYPEFGIMPVRYFPHLSLFHLSLENNRLWKKLDNVIELDPFTKVPTHLNDSIDPPEGHNAEHFESIYEEREWRSVTPITLSLDEIAFILLPSRTYVDKARFPKTIGLIEKGVGMIVADDLFRRTPEKKGSGK